MREVLVILRVQYADAVAAPRLVRPIPLSGLAVAAVVVDEAVAAVVVVVAAAAAAVAVGSRVGAVRPT